jgi:HlyD family secretion protein
MGEPVKFTVDAFPDRQFRGKVAQIRLIATVNQNVVTYPVIVEVSNPDLLLRPTMTANVTIDVATVRDTLRVPNAALRWKPEGTTVAAAATPEERPARSGQGGAGQGGAGQGGNAATARQPGQAGGGGGASGAGRSGGGRGARPTTIYEPQGPKGEPKPIEIRPGITDGRFTQVVSGDVKVGDTVIVGLATAKANAPGATAPGTAPGGGGRRF